MGICRRPREERTVMQCGHVLYKATSDATVVKAIPTGLFIAAADIVLDKPEG